MSSAKEQPAAPSKEINRRRLGEALKEAREYLELSQDEVARVLGLPRPAISLIEAGQRKVEAIELAKFAELYQRPIGYFTGEDTPKEAVPETVRHLARTAAKLTDKDREELLRFAQFLQSRGDR